MIRGHLPSGIRAVYSSPLRRCALLARHLFPGHSISWEEELKEVHCGQWEMKNWDDLPKDEIDPWMADFVNIRMPGGESYLDVQERVTRCWNRVRGGGAATGLPALRKTGAEDEGDAVAIVAHGGVIRSILSGITGTPLIDSFKVFSLHYGCVIRVFEEGDGFGHEILSNQAPAAREQHKPSGYYK